MRPWVVFVALSAIAWATAADEQTSLREEARALAATFAGQLKPQLTAAMQDGGPVQAIEVCAAVAPGIADALSASSGWQVKRVSLRQRNATRAVPDEWERQVLEGFDQSVERGESAKGLYKDELQAAHYRYIQAQTTEAICLTCHGENLTPAVTAQLKQYYPDDLARGYQLGQVRGAISLIKPLEKNCGPDVAC